MKWIAGEIWGCHEKAQRPSKQAPTTIYGSSFDFGKVGSVKGQNMKRFDCPSFQMVYGPMFWLSWPPFLLLFWYANLWIRKMCYVTQVQRSLMVFLYIVNDFMAIFAISSSKIERIYFPPMGIFHHPPTGLLEHFLVRKCNCYWGGTSWPFGQ